MREGLPVWPEKSRACARTGSVLAAPGSAGGNGSTPIDGCGDRNPKAAISRDNDDRLFRWTMIRFASRDFRSLPGIFSETRMGVKEIMRRSNVPLVACMPYALFGWSSFHAGPDESTGDDSGSAKSVAGKIERGGCRNMVRTNFPPPSARNRRFRPVFETESFVPSAQGDRRKPWVRDAFPDSPSNLKGSLTHRRATACTGPLSDPFRIEEQGEKQPRYPGLPSVGLGWKSEAVSLEESAKPAVSIGTQTEGY